MACPTRRSRTDCSSAARPSSTTSPTCWRSSACAAVLRRPRTRPGPRNRGSHRSRAARATPFSAQLVREECAMYLARQGYRGLLVDRAEFPSDTVSTHVVQAPAIAALHRWGLLPEVVASGAPPINTYSFDFGPLQITGKPQPVDGFSAAYAPRRTVLDKILVDAAVRAGVELRERFSVDGYLVEDGAVVGVRGHEYNGAAVVERAHVVIGADGRDSELARTVHAKAYAEKPRAQWAYYTYFRDLPVDGFEIYIRPNRGWAACATNDGLTMVVLGWLIAEADA